MEKKCDRCGAKAVGGYDRMYVKYDIQEDGTIAYGEADPNFGIDSGEDMCADCLTGWEAENRVK